MGNAAKIPSSLIINIKNVKLKPLIDQVNTGHKSIPLDISNKVRESICKIIIKKEEKKRYGTGFFMKISESLKFLFTNYHVINQDFINDNIEIEIWNKEKMNLNLNQRYIKFFEKPKDVTVIQIKEEDKIYKDIKFLDYDLNYKERGYNIYKKGDVFALEHPSGDIVSSASGKILEVKNYEFAHDIYTENGSSGCPIILLNNNINSILVIGIHKGSDNNQKINYGTFIGEIINEFKNDSNFFPKIERNKEEEKGKISSDTKDIKNKFNDSENKDNVIINEKKINIIEISDNKNNVIIDKKANLTKKDNVIISKINIKKDDVNKFIRILNSYEEILRFNGKNNLEESLKNEEEIKECEIRINDELIKFKYFHTFKNEGDYTIEYTFKNLLTKTDYMFFECSSLINIDLSNFSTQNVTNMYSMFNGCSSLINIDLSNFNTQNVTNMSCMFKNCSSLINIDLSNFNTQNVIYIDSMFNGCSSLINIDLSNFDTQNATNMYSMFNGCSSLKNINLSNFNTQSITDMSYMFSGCSSLIYIDVSNFNTQNVTNMSHMFFECSSLENIDLSSFNTQNVSNMCCIFYNCSSLKAANLLNFDIAKFSEHKCDKFNTKKDLLKLLKIKKDNKKDIFYCMFYGCTYLKGNIIIKDHKIREKLNN